MCQVDETGNTYIANYNKTAFRPSPQTIDSYNLELDSLRQPYSVAVDDDMMLVAESEDHRVSV